MRRHQESGSENPSGGTLASYPANHGLILEGPTSTFLHNTSLTSLLTSSSAQTLSNRAKRRSPLSARAHALSSSPSPSPVNAILRALIRDGCHPPHREQAYLLYITTCTRDNRAFIGDQTDNACDGEDTLQRRIMDLVDRCDCHDRREAVRTSQVLTGNVTAIY